MAKKFVVSASKGCLSSSPMLQVVALGLPIMAAIVYTQETFEDQRIRVLISVLLGLVVLVGLFLLRGGGKSEELEVSVSVNQLSVQLTTYRNGKIIGYPLLISRRDIVDIVVNEVILSHRVVSVLVFRVLKLTGTAAPEAKKLQPMHSLLKENSIRLQVAFPSVDMSYNECMTMRGEISRTLGLIKT
jgi:hypothetical protein